jgi:AcrR family transcriptional regulator
VSNPGAAGGAESVTAQSLLDATERVMLQDGYAAVTSRRVATEAGVTGGLVHYYFPTLDDLFLATYRRRTEQNQRRLSQDLASTAQPLWTIWEYSLDATAVALTQEFMALANHRKAIRAEIQATAERLRQMQLAVVEPLLTRYGIDPSIVTAAGLLVFMSAVPRVLVLEQTLGLSTGHADAVATVERLLTESEGTRDAVATDQFKG